jgi:DNA-binding response OmpR family regulator
MPSPSLQGRSILVVEDQSLIVMDIADALEAAGASITSTTTLHHALLLVEHDGISAAIIDHVLGDGDSSELCGRLKARGIPFLMYSGLPKIDGECKGALHLQKPASPEELVAGVEDLIRGASVKALSGTPLV